MVSEGGDERHHYGQRPVENAGGPKARKKAAVNDGQKGLPLVFSCVPEKMRQKRKTIERRPTQNQG